MRISTKGMKGHDIDLELERLTVLTGPNESGKSTAAEAVRFAAIGYVPALGKRPADTAALVRDGSMSVRLAIDESRTILRTLDRTERGFVQGAQASWLKSAKTTTTEASEEIRGLFGAEELDVAECLDIRQLLAATPNQRAARIEQLLAAGQKSPRDLAVAVARWIAMRLADVKDESRMPKDYTKALEMAPEKQVKILDEVGDDLLAKITATGIIGALTWANDEKNRAADGLRKKQAAESELRIRAAEIPEPSQAEIDRLEADRVTIHQDLGAARERGAAAKRAEDARAAAQREFDSSQLQLADAKTIRAGVEERVKQLEDLKAQLAHANRALDEANQAPPQQPSDNEAQELDKRAQDLNAQLADLTPSFAGVPDVAGQEARVASLEEHIEALAKSPWSEIKKIGQRLSKSKVDGVKADGARLVELAAAALKDEPDHLDDMLATAKAALVDFKARAAEISKSNVDKVEKAKRIREEISGLQSRSRKSREDRRQKFETEHEGWRQRVRELTGHKVGIVDRIKEIEEQDRRTLGVLERAAVAVQSGGKRLADILAQEPPAAATGFEDLKKKLDETVARLNTLAHAKATHSEIRHVLDSIETAKAEHAVFSAIEWGLQRQREREISSAEGPLLRILNEFLQAAGRQERAFIRASQGVCVIGWKTPAGHEVPIQTMSGGGWTLFAAGMTAAVVLIRPSILKVLLVEAGETKEILPQLLAGIRAIAPPEEAGHFTAIVMTPHVDEGAVFPDWNVVRLQHEEARAA